MGLPFSLKGKVEMRVDLCWSVSSEKGRFSHTTLVWVEHLLSFLHKEKLFHLFSVFFFFNFVFSHFLHGSTAACSSGCCVSAAASTRD